MKTRNKLYDKSRLRLLCLLTALLGIFGAGQTWAQPSGAGTQASPYQISTADELRWFAGLVNGTLTDDTEQNTAAWATLTADIDLGGEAWTPIGNYSASTSLKYTGTFDGAGHTISNLTTVDNSSSNYQGFVGYLGTNGVIKNLTLDESSVAGCYYVGGICGYNSGTTENCANTDTVNGEQYVGGVCGYNEGGTITNCANGGAVTSTYQYVGGVCGENKNGSIESCYNTGAVNGDLYVGGVCGENKNGSIESCYNTGAVNGDLYVGGVCGANSGTIKSCYWLNTAYSGNGIGIGFGSETNVASKTVDQFASGEVAYLLQGSQTVLTWGQALGTDDYPVLTTEEAKRIYAAKLYNGSAKATDVYANASGFSLPEGNALLVIEDAVSASTGTNIIVKNGDAYTCANLKLTDGADFYTPVAFTATQATYSRQLATGTQWGTVALPFDATSVTGAELFRVASQDGDALYVDETGGMTDGEPLVFRANAEVTTVDFKGTGVAVRATDAATTGTTLLVGTSQAVDELAEGAYFIYGDMFYRVAAGSQVGMKAFRAYIPAATGASTRSAGAASQLRIVFNASETTRAAHEGN